MQADGQFIDASQDHDFETWDRHQEDLARDPHPNGGYSFEGLSLDYEFNVESDYAFNDDRRSHAGFFIVVAEGVPTKDGAKVGCVMARFPPEVWAALGANTTSS